ncbi:MAG: hypothetical protein Q9165_005201 [Trypethelium subeluteriae]
MVVQTYLDRLNHYGMGSGIRQGIRYTLQDSPEEWGPVLPREQCAESGTVTYWNLCRLIGVIPEDAPVPHHWNVMRLHAILQIRGGNLPGLIKAVEVEQDGAAADADDSSATSGEDGWESNGGHLVKSSGDHQSKKRKL